MKNIAKTLKQLREQNGLTRREVAEKLLEYGIDISDKTLYGYESGRSSANADMFLALCKVYKCTNILNTFGCSTEEVLFTNSEWEMIEKYRLLDPHGQETVNIILDREAARVKQLQDATAPAALIELQSTQNGARIIEYFRSASAGGGVFILGNELADEISIPDIPEYRCVDLAIKVSGDSMLPDFRDGDTVLVSQNAEMRLGDIGIFVINNTAYIKEYGEKELVSRNPDAENIKISEYDNIVCMGKVIGKL